MLKLVLHTVCSRSGRETTMNTNTFVMDRAARLEREAGEAFTYANNAIPRERLARANALHRQMRDNYRPTATPDSGEFWRVILERTAGEREAGFRGWTRSVLVTHAGEAYGTVTGDHARVQTILDDVIQDSRETAHARLSELTADATATPCAGDCGGSECAAELDSPYGVTRVTLSGAPVIGWHTLRLVKCGECVPCVGKRGVSRCEAPTTRAVWVSVGAVIGASLKTASRSALKRDPSQGVEWFSDEASEFGFTEIVSAEMRAHEADAPATRGVSDAALAEVRRAVKVADLMGAELIAANGAVSQAVGDALAAGRGYALSERGRRSARAAVIEAGTGGRVIRTGAARKTTLSGQPRPESRRGLKHDAPVEVFAVTIRPVNPDRRSAPKAL